MAVESPTSAHAPAPMAQPPPDAPPKTTPLYPPPHESKMSDLHVPPPPIYQYYNMLLDGKVYRIPVRLPLMRIEEVHKQLGDGLGLGEDVTISGFKIGSGTYFPFFHLGRLPPWDIYEPILVPSSSTSPSSLRSPPFFAPPSDSTYGPLGIPLAHLTPASLATTPDLYHAASRSLADVLCTTGYAVVRASKEDANMFRVARREALQYFKDIPEEEKKKTRKVFGNEGKFVGYAKTGAREWFQVRTTPGGEVRQKSSEEHVGTSAQASETRLPEENNTTGPAAIELRPMLPSETLPPTSPDTKLPSPSSPPDDPFSLMHWPPAPTPSSFRPTMTALYATLDRLSRLMLPPLLSALNVPTHMVHEVEAMLDPPFDTPPNSTSTDHPPPEVGSSVLRVYQYYRAPNTPLPGLANAATGLHADMGFLTLSPVSNVPGLVGMGPRCDGWVDVESGLVAQGEKGADAEGEEDNGAVDEAVFVMAGDTLSEVLRRLRLREHFEAVGALGGGVNVEPNVERKSKDPITALPPGLHYVDEKVMGKARISMPFFLRPRPTSLLPVLPQLSVSFSSDHPSPAPPPSTTPVPSSPTASDAPPSFPPPPVPPASLAAPAPPPPLRTATPEEIQTVADFIEKEVFMKRPWSGRAKGDY
ncbi:hypothetical protein M427DRAFT_52865 [Gonapodya prolifera JEL478]|uniref:Fe2OG dioxygenase domain-containing protein n=1 Tax=Gonapodya prolifera (strain JEL478) TaxID=1344416 RepID=A0A139ASG3_GONPJ|nr:hypothetical protein M427DRAFT_52865 [Gonapodya prolifera JEL478]|eukprot:KXS19425.1 hypothetical protein M427DRAFT_52865 [Gonapodya prolifera JEL478]